MIGRKTNGGLVMMSMPLMFATGTGLGLDEGLGLSDGDGDDDGDGESEGVGDSAGVGDGGPWRVKSACGLGGTLAYRWCSPGASPGNGLTTTVKAPLLLATVDPATRLGSSQYRVMLSLGRKSWPVTVIPMLGPPAAGSSPIVANTGVGVGTGDGVGVGVGVGA
jgi:hypothetical protein